MTEHDDRNPRGTREPMQPPVPPMTSEQPPIHQPTREELRKSVLLKLLRMEPATRQRLLELERQRRGLPRG